MKERINLSSVKSLMAKLNIDDNNEKDIHDELSYLKKKIKKDMVTVKYNYKFLKFGRLYPNDYKGCYLGLSSNVRAYLAKEHYTYLDLSKCHLNIIKFICKHYSIDHGPFDDLLVNFKTYEQQYELPKNIINCALFFDKFNHKLECLNKINKIIHKPGGLCDKLAENEQFIDLYKHVLTTKESQDVDNSFMALVCQTIEERIVRRAIEYLRTNTFFTEAYIYDGIFVRGPSNSVKTEKNERNINLDDLNNNLKCHYMNFYIEPVFKIEEFTWSEQFNEIVMRDAQNDMMPEEFDKMTDLEVAQELLNEHKDEIFKFEEDIYIKHQNVWKINDFDIFNIWIQNSFIDISNPKDPCRKYIRDLTSSWKNYIMQLKTLIKCLPENFELGNLLDNQRDILAFQDGYYDFLKGKFISYDDPEAIILYITAKLDLKIFNLYEVDERKYRKIESIFLDMFNNDHEAFNEVFSCLVRYLSGHIEDKNWMSITGERNSGKGVLQLMIERCFSNMIGILNSSELLLKSGSFESCERRNGFMAPLVNKRIVFSSECPTGSVIDGNIMKQIASGGDKQVFREAYGRKVCKPIRAGFVILCQNLPNIKPVDARKNLLAYNMPNQYLDVIPNDNIIRGFNVKQADNTIKELWNDIEYIKASIKFVFSFYKRTKPEYPLLKCEAEEELETIEGVSDPSLLLHKKFNEHFVITKNDSDRISSGVILNTLIKYIDTLNTRKLKLFLINSGAKHVKIQGKMYYKNVAFKEEQDESESKYL